MAEGLSVALPLEVNSIDGAYGVHKDLQSVAYKIYPIHKAR